VLVVGDKVKHLGFNQHGIVIESDAKTFMVKWLDGMITHCVQGYIAVVKE